MIAKAQAVEAPIPASTSDLLLIPQPMSLFHQTWPVAVVAAAVIVNLAWMGILGYGFFKLVEPAFF